MCTCVCTLTTYPQQIGKEVIKVLNAKAERDGGASAPKDRWPGINWIGIDESGLCKKTPYLTKMGWFATPDSTKGAMALQKLIKKISGEVLSSNMPMDFYLAEMNVPDQEAAEKTKVICDVLSRNTTIDVSVEDENEGTQGEDTTPRDRISLAGLARCLVPCASEHRRNPPPVGEFEFRWAVVY